LQWRVLEWKDRYYNTWTDVPEEIEYV
jgi:hypothetical protein